jgi:hypothetical protein
MTPMPLKPRLSLNRYAFTPSMALAAALASSAWGGPGITTYSDRPTWVAAASGAGNIHCDDIELDTPGNYPTPPPYFTAGGTGGGGSWSFVSQGSQVVIQVLTGGIINGSQEIHFRDFGVGVNVRPPCPITPGAGSSFGFDYATSEPWTVVIGGQNFVLPANTIGFFGVVASGPIPSFVLTSPIQPQGGISVDNLCCGAAGQSDPCRVDSIQLNSGFEHMPPPPSGGAVYPIGALDSWYTVISDPDPGTTEPRPAGVILKHPAWANPEPNSQWLGGYPTSQAILNGFYVYQVCFCLQQGFQNVSITLGARADDIVNVYLNETLADVLNSTATPIHFGQSHNAPVMNFTTFNNQSRFQVGRNCLMFRVENTGAVASGLNSIVTINAPGGFVLDPVCCANGGSISGQKWNDLNGDGIRQSNEPILPGWTINLNPGNLTAVTDSNGFYYFNGLNPGTYVITETLQPQWVQTSPPGGSHTVTIAANQSVQGYDFGNMFSPCMTITPGTILCETGRLPTGGIGLTGCFLYTFTITNQSGVTAQYVLFPSNNITPHIINLGPGGLPNGASTTVTIKICNVMPGQHFCFNMILADAQVQECCAREHCVDIPDCFCYQTPTCQAVFLPPQPGSTTTDFSVLFTLQNLTPDVVEHMFVFPPSSPPSPCSGTVMPDYIDLPTLPPFATTAPIKVVVKMNCSPAEGSTICFRISIHNQRLQECCSKEKCFVVHYPQPPPTCPADCDFNGYVNVDDLFAVIQSWGQCPVPPQPCMADVTRNGWVNIDDVFAVIQSWGPCP